MNPIAAVLVPLDGSATAAKSLGCATWIAARLGAKLHILSATEQERSAHEELSRLKLPEEDRSLIVLHQAPAYPEDAILAAVERHDMGLVVMTARGGDAEQMDAEDSGPLKIVGHVTRAVIEQCPVPVLLLPPGYVERLPWQRALMPVSGEAEADEVLTFAVHFVNALGIKLDIAHVAEAAEPAEVGLGAEAQYADAAHHEYPARLDALIRRGLPQCTPEECRCIEDVSLCRGDIAVELLKQIEQKRISLLVVGWHGRFMAGHARVLKHLIEVITCPLLLVKAAPPAPFELKVGEALD
jgi:nucleotide-binding universal stress UspA family protein